MFLFKFFIIISLILCTSSQAVSKNINPSSCTSLQYYNYVKFICDSCPPNNQGKFNLTYCNCNADYYKDPNFIGFQSNAACISNPIPGSSIYLLNNKDGSVANTSLNCSSTNAYPNAERTSCIPCPQNMTINTTTKVCQCISGYQKIDNRCIVGSTSLTDTDKVQNGCINPNYPIPKYCQFFLNLCIKEKYLTQSSFCNMISEKITNDKINSNNFPKYQIQQSDLLLNQLNINVSTSEFMNTTQLKNKLDFYVAEFDLSGQFLDFRPLRNQLFSCNLSEGDSIKFQSFGTSYIRQCNIKLSPTPSYQLFYDLYIKGANGSFAIVPVQFINSNRSLIRRFSPSKQSIKLNLTSSPPLLTPLVTISIIPNTQQTAKIQNQSITSNDYVLLPPFIILNVIVLGYYIYALFLHVKYNPQNLGQNTYCFRMLWGAFWLALRCWTVGLFVWLAGVSMFLFCFYKFQTALFIILPDPENSTSNALYYTPFKTVFFIMVAMGLICFFQIIWRIATAQYFLLDWEGPKENPGKFSTQHNNKQIKPSIWRRLFVVNELYELAMKRLSSVQFTLLFTGLFLQGLQWSNLKYMIPNSQVDTLSSVTNPVLAYFITSFLLITISLLQVVIRKLLKIWWPLPQQEFMDLCCISNLSIFIFDQGIHGYYIHGMSPLGRSEGSLQYIESIFQKQSESYGRNRGLLEDDQSQVQAYQVIAPRVMRFEFNKLYVQRIQQIMSYGVMANTIISKPVPELKSEHYDNLQKLREQMLNNFRLYLQQVKIHKSTQIKQRNWFTRMFSCPPSAELHQKLPVMYKDSDNLFTNVFLSGNELFLLINQINIFNLWYLVIGNTFHSVILTMVIKLLLNLFMEFKMKRNISLNTFVDDKFFI